MSFETAIEVLLIDDDEDDFVVVRDQLRDIRGSRFNVTWAPNPAEARARMKERSFQAYLIDYRLGEFTGIDLMKEVVSSGDPTPIILLTGYGDPEVDQEAMRLGASDFMVKGELSPQLLERSIRYSIHRNEMQAQAISQDRMASVGLLASSLAHEIGTPLGVIRGRAEFLAMQVKDQPAVKTNVDIIVSQIDRVSHLIRSLLNLARGDAAESVGPTSVERPVAEVIELLEHELNRQGIRVDNQLARQPEARVLASSDKLHQIVLNLVINAIHAIDSAKSAARSAKEHLIRLSLRDDDTHWILSVEDTGCGISKENLTKLFRPFFTTKDIGVGTGLGLATAYRTVQSWNGSIEVDSKVGLGSAFRIRLPKA